jgi:hypothetical protein
MRFFVGVFVLIIGCNNAPSPGSTNDNRAGGEELTISRDLTIDAATADLSRVGMMLVSASGDMLLTQAEDGVIRVFNASGESLPSIGGTGSGPGEFQRLTRVGWRGDSLWTLDPALARVSVFGPDYKFVRSMPHPMALVSAEGEPAQEGNFFVQALMPDGSLRVILTLRDGFARPAWAADVDSGAHLLMSVNPAGQIIKRLAMIPRDNCNVIYSIGSKGIGNATIPFCARPVSTEWEGGSAIVLVNDVLANADSGTYRVLRVDENGATQFDRRLSYVTSPVTQAEVDSNRAMLEKALASSPPELLSARPNLEPASTHPPIRRIVLGEDGTTWLEEYSAQPERPWIMLDKSGNHAGRVILPINVRLMAANLQHIWAIETDADDVPGIVRYRISSGN